jgi:hypothetical protein
LNDKLTDTVTISPVGSMDLLSQLEVAKLRDIGHGGLRERFRRCALAVLNTGSPLDDARAVYERFADFEIELLQVERGIRLRMRNAPAQAFVDGELIHGIREHLFAVLRDVIYVSNEIEGRNGLDSPAPSPTPCSRSCATRACCGPASRPTSWSAGAGTRSAARSTTTPRASATTSDCAA